MSSDMHRSEPTIAKVGVIGAGYMGGGIAQTIARHRYDVVVADADPAHARQAVTRLTAQARTYVEDGLWPPGADVAVVNHLKPGTVIEACAEADYITEAVPEDGAIKRAVLTAVAKAARDDTVVATNTSAISLTDLTDCLPQPLLAVHWFNPAPFLPLVEIAGDDAEAIDRVTEMLISVGKRPVRVAGVPGFLANRLQFALYREAALVLEEGLATADQIDEVVRNSFGYRLPFFGPLAVGDIAGLDVYADTFATLAAEYGPRFAAPAVLEERVRAGALGLKSGSGITSTAARPGDAVARYRDSAFTGLTGLRDALTLDHTHDSGADVPHAPQS